MGDQAMADFERFIRAMRLCKEQCTAFTSKFYRLAKRRAHYGTPRCVSRDDEIFYENMRQATENLALVNEMLRKQMAIWKWEDKQRVGR
jgi:hypothetical protein